MAASQDPTVFPQRQYTNSTIFFENSSSKRYNRIKYLPYLGTRSRQHHNQKLFIPQILRDYRLSLEETFEDFAKHFQNVFNGIRREDLPSMIVTVRTGVLYFYSKRFRFNKTYRIEEIPDLLTRTIRLENANFYYAPRDQRTPTDDHLRSAFSNMKPISEHEKFVEELSKYEFHVKRAKHVFRIYLESNDGQQHVCTVDPAQNYSIVEFSKDFQRVANIDIIRDRSESKFQQTSTFDDIFDFRIQFQHDPRTPAQSTTRIEEELLQQFPSLQSTTFRNEFVLKPIGEHIDDYREFEIPLGLTPFVRFIRRDFGDVYEYDGNDTYFENFTIFLESSIEYRLNRFQSTCQRELDSHGIVYARLDLKTMLDDQMNIDVEFLANKLWDMGHGLSDIAGQCSTMATQQGTNYYTSNGNIYTAEEEFLVQTINQQRTFPRMLGLTDEANARDIQEAFVRIINQLEEKWMFIPSGRRAWDKIHQTYEEYNQI